MEKENKYFVEAESFSYYGGWVLDSQFEEEMGSPYLLAHGMGKPVKDAATKLCVEAGKYNVWVRTKDWVSHYHPGRFTLLIDGAQVGGALGANDSDWNWQAVGTVTLSDGEHMLSLHDLTGFEGRCDAIYLATDELAPPELGKQIDRKWRKALLGLPDEPVMLGTYDVVVVGGGVAGCTAALAAAKTGSRVALVSDRPVLGGNASTEIGLGPRGYKGAFVQELCRRTDNGELAAVQMLKAESNVTLFLNEKVFGVVMNGNAIEAVDMRNSVSSAESRLSAKVFIDASGRAAIARPAGAEIRTGREGRSEYGESLAPEKGDEKHHGHTVLYHLRESSYPLRRASSTESRSC